MTAAEQIDLGENPLALDRQVCFALAVASRSVIGIYRPLLEPKGLTHPQYLVMLALWDREPRSVKDIGATLRLEPATLSPMITASIGPRLLSMLAAARNEAAVCP